MKEEEIKKLALDLFKIGYTEAIKRCESSSLDISPSIEDNLKVRSYYTAKRLIEYLDQKNNTD